MSNSEERLRYLYYKAKEYRGKTGFQSHEAFETYSEALFKALNPGNKIPAEELNLRYSVFSNQLTQWTEADRDFDKLEFQKHSKSNLSSRTKETHTFFFGIHVRYQDGATFPIKRQLKIKGVKFEVVPYSRVVSLPGNPYIQSLLEEYKTSRYSNESEVRRILEKEYVYFKSSTNSIDELVSANRMMSAFELFTAAVSLAQERGNKVHYMGAGVIKNRKPIQNPHLLYWAEADNEFTSILTNIGSEISIPDARLTFTSNPNRLKSYNRYLNILKKEDPTPIEKRIIEFSLEFDKALDVEQPHLRMLSLWRCLELATRLSNGATRQQKDIIGTLSKYYTSDYWREQGSLILDTRNRYVHEGTELSHQNRDLYLGWLQDYATAVLSQLMWMREQRIGYKDSTEIDNFFNLFGKPVSILEVASKMSNARKKNPREDQ